MKGTARPLERFADALGLAERAASIIASTMDEAIRRKGEADLVLTGGRTPIPLYRIMSRAPWRGMVPWDRIRVFLSDERCVPPDDRHSNHFAVRAALLDSVPVNPSKVFPIPAWEGAKEGADRYEATLRALFPGAPAPDFDLVLLGMGADGHTASLFFGDPAMKETDRWVLPVQRKWGSPAVHRVTLSLPALCAGRTALMLVTGAGKKKPLEKALLSSPADSLMPAGRVTSRGRPARWLVASD